MAAKTIYIRLSDEAFWERAEAEAQKQGEALTVFVSRLIRNYFYDVGSKQKSLDDLARSDLLTEVEATATRLVEQIGELRSS